jgi:hypothetical protein
MRYSYRPNVLPKPPLYRTQVLNQLTQHWHTDRVRNPTVPASSAPQVYESHMG